MSDAGKRSDKVREIFWGLCDLPSEAREAALEVACDADSTLIVEVRSLLDAYDESSSLLDVPALEAHGHWFDTLEEVDTAEVVDSPDADSKSIARRYRLLESIAHGGVGEVLRGFDLNLNREVAIKRLHPEHARKHSVRARFAFEAQIGGQLQHPGIVPVYEFGAEGSVPFLAMQLVRGHTLAELLAARDPDQPEVQRFLPILLQVSQAVAFAHSRGVVHRDLKPHNVMVGRFGEVQIVDWGLAKIVGSASPGDDEGPLIALDSAEDRVSILGSVLGTPAYMPPEQAAGRLEDVDQRADVFALGAVLCEILTGSPPYVSAATDSSTRRSEVLAQAVEGRLAPALVRISQCEADPEWRVLCSECLATAPADRCADAGVLADRIERHLAGAEQRLQAARVTAETARTRLRGLLAVVAAGIVGLSFSLYFWGTAAAQGEVARTHLGRFHELSNVVRLRRAIEAEKTLYPARPDRLPALRSWLQDEARPLIEALPGLRESHAAIAMRLEDRATPTRLGDEFLRETLSRLIGDIESFESDVVAGVVSRELWASTIERLSIERFKDPWHRARLAIAAADGVASSEAYADHPIDLKPQLGLAPIGMNPVTKLWEFYHLHSAWDSTTQPDPEEVPVPRHRPDGSITVGESTGIVFVLIPGGTFTMGAQAVDRAHPNYDKQAAANEQPVTAVTLAPFFLARHELTQGQWTRLSRGPNPSRYVKPKYSEAGMPAPIDASHPVESIDWTSCDELLRHSALSLPTESQWEYACRAGSTTPWWTGTTRDTLRGAANLADQAGTRVGASWAAIAEWPELDDGHGLHAPVGSMQPNPWGLFHLHGNVWEWCRDGAADYTEPPRAGDGLRPTAADSTRRIYRGSSFANGATHARSSNRDHGLAVGTRFTQIGLRAARAVD